MVSIVPHSGKLLHRKILVAAMQAPLSFFVSTDAGEIVNRFSQDMTLVVCESLKTSTNQPIDVD